jgi:hypothetical protein
MALLLRPFLLAVALSAACGTPSPAANATNDLWTIDFRYAPPSWQTAICLPDDWQKTLVGKDGCLLYDYPGSYAGFGTRITFALSNETRWVNQELVSPRVPIVRTTQRNEAVEVVQAAFAVAPPRLSPRPEAEVVLERLDSPANNPPRHDLVIVRMRNTGASEARIAPTLTIESTLPITPDVFRRRVQIGAWTTLTCSPAIVAMEKHRGRVVLRFPEGAIPAQGEGSLAFAVARGRNAPDLPLDPSRVESLRRKSEHFWRTLALPYDRLEIPDLGVQALLDSSIRNIYQAREIKKGLPAFQVGPTCYRGLWVVDGSFLLEAMTYLGRADETRDGVKYLMSFQREDGSFMLMDAHWKETGIALWAITRHARLTGDKNWLREAWPRVERGFAFIRKMRAMPAAAAPNARLIPDGFSDGGLADKVPEYTNIYWTLAGLRAAVEAARWLGKAEQADNWQKEYDDFLQTFRRAAQRDTRTDAHGNHYVPIRMQFDEKVPPQKAQWAFLHSLFPGKVFSPNDPLVQGNLAMLEAVEQQGLVQDTGWLKDGIWTYFGSFYAHAWLWLGEGDKAARTLYAFGNHASPLLAWREEQMPVGQGDQVVGDMPHNWASAEFIRLVRHSLILERGNELHLFEAMPAKWVRPGAVTRVRDIATEFGPLSFEFRVARDGASGILKLTPPQRTPPARIVLHLDHWSAQTGTLDLPVRGPSTKKVNLRRTL